MKSLITTEVKICVGKNNAEFILNMKHTGLVLTDWEGRVGSYPLDKNNAPFIVADIVAYILGHSSGCSTEELVRVVHGLVSLFFTFLEI